MLRRRILAEWSAIALFALLLVCGAIYSGLTERFDNLLYDSASRFYAAPRSDKILIAEIDNDSLAALGAWPWSRATHARMIRALTESGAKVIAYDVLFLEPGDTSGDQALGEAIQVAPPVVLPVLYQVPGLNGAEADLLRPLPSIARSAQQGSVNLVFDSDGLIRRFELESRLAGQKMPHLMELAYRATNGSAPSAASSTAVEPHDTLVPFAATGSFRHVPFAKLLAGEVPSAFLRGKTVLVGATAPGLGDQYSVPGAQGTMTGIEIQANLLSALISNRTIAPLARPIWAGLSLAPVMLLMLAFLRLTPGANLAASLLAIGVVIVASLSVLALLGVWVPPGPALLGLIIVYPLWGWRRLQALSSFVSGQAALLASDLKDGRKTKAVGGLDRIAEEATALGRVIGDMRSVRQFMADVIAGFPDPICVADASGQVTLANAAAERVLGQDVVGEVFDRALGRLPSAVEDGDGEVKDAAGHHYLLRRVPFRDGSHAAGGEIIRLADITELKQAGQEREEMLQFLSHDMRAPQAAIIALANHPEGQASPWARVSAYARHTLDLADEFVQLARLRSVGVSKEAVDIANVMTEAIDLCWAAAKAKRSVIFAEGIDDPVFVSGDGSALTRVFANLIGNAVKYCPEGSEIRCSLKEVGGQAECTVADNGPGLPMDRVEDAFLRFGSRQDASGSGLGLAFVKGVIDQHHGEVTVVSAPGNGTRFKVTVPLSD